MFIYKYAWQSLTRGAQCLNEGAVGPPAFKKMDRTPDSPGDVQEKRVIWQACSRDRVGVGVI